MSGIANQLRTKQGAIIGAGVVIVITAITIWSWKSSSPSKKDTDSSEERSVKTKKEPVARQPNDMAAKQSQTKEDVKESIIVKEKEVTIAVEEVQDLPIEKKKGDEKIVVTETVTEVIETHYDEASSVKSHTLSAATSSADETDICTPEHEANTTTDVKHPESSAPAQIDTQNNSSYLSENKNDNVEKVKFDWTEESVKAALPPINRDIVTVSTTALESAENVAVSLVTESQEQEEYVVIERPTEKEAVKEQEIATPVAVAVSINTDEEPVLSEKVELSSSEKSPTSLSSSLTASAPEFVPKSHQQPKKPTKKFLTREQLIEQQRQHHMPRSKARCSHWPHCTNNNCKFFHPYRACRAGDDCLFGDRCMFVHPNDCTVNVRDNNKSAPTTAAAASISA